MNAGLFDSLDLNGDGEVSRAELHQAARRLGWHWHEAPLFAILDLLTVQHPMSRARFEACMHTIQTDPMGPYGTVLLNAQVFTAAGAGHPKKKRPSPHPCPTPLSVDPQPHATAQTQDALIARIAATVGADVAHAYQSTRAKLASLELATDRTAILVIDPQHAFTQGVWMQSIGAGGEADVVPIQIAFEGCARLVGQYYGSIDMMFTRCPFPPNSYGWEQGLANILDHDQIYLLKPGNSIFFPPSNGFKLWVEQRMADGMRTLVMGGCTFNSCVRVSAIEAQQWFRAEGLQVVVDWELSGARACNYLPSAQYNGLSAVADAIEQMRGAGVKVAQAVAWQ